MPGPKQPATAAAARVSRAGALLAALGVASSLFVVMRLLETWHLSPPGPSHRITVLGLPLSYPKANLAAVVVLVLALVGLAVMLIAIAAMTRELVRATRFQRSLATSRRLGDAFVIAEDRPLAFCAGLLRPRVYVSSGAIALLDAQALQTVLEHERHHARRRDPLRLACGRVAAKALFFMPGVQGLVTRHQSLAEMSADEMAITAGPGSRSALARAMLGFSDAWPSGDRVGIDPARIDHVLGEATDWRFPVVLFLLALSAILVLAGLAVLAGAAASGSASLALPVLSSRPCVMILSTIPALVGMVALRLRGAPLQAAGRR